MYFLSNYHFECAHLFIQIEKNFCMASIYKLITINTYILVYMYVYKYMDRNRLT